MFGVYLVHGVSWLIKYWVEGLSARGSRGGDCWLLYARRQRDVMDELTCKMSEVNEVNKKRRR